MRYYIQSVNDAGEIVGVPEELITCEHCRYFTPADGIIPLPKENTCLHPDAMVNPMPDSWCSFRLEKHHHD